VPKNVTLQVRSIYLRGILTDQYRQIQRFSTAASKFHDLCSKYGYDPALIAFKYVKKFAPESTIVLGIDSEIQLRKLISWESQAINEDFLEIINEIYEDRVEFIDPRYWRN
jgi:aryl-alcohol dehydrogenase-like predicted oxidoreductase